MIFFFDPTPKSTWFSGEITAMYRGVTRQGPRNTSASACS